jgi:hypothetical protein
MHGDRNVTGANAMTMRTLRMTTAITTTMMAVWLGAMSGAGAQAPSAAPSPAPGAGAQQPPANISDQKLDATAAAIEHVTAVTHDYQQKMAKANPADKERLAGEANGALVKAVTDQGLSVDEYNSILRVAQNDPALRAKTMQRLHRSPK